MIDDETLNHVSNTIASAASLAAVSMLQKDKPIGYATLEGQGGQSVGIVIVCLNEKETTAMLAYIRSRGGEIILGRPE